MSRVMSRATPLAAMLAAGLFAASPASAEDRIPPDPLNSVMWEDMAERFFTDGPIRFDDKVKVIAPKSAEDQFFVPVTVDATGIADIKEIVVVADLNPIPHILTYRPDDAAAFIGFRLKVEQATAVHAGVRLADGSWRIGGTLIDAAGGGCTAPAGQHAQVDWMARLGETRARIWRRGDGTARMRLRMRHPMDTGLADGVPVFYMEKLTISRPDGKVVARVELFEPLSENPTLTLLPRLRASDTKVDVFARDTEANEFTFSVPAPFEQSALGAARR